MPTLSEGLAHLTGEAFEHLCRDLLVGLGFADIDWLKGGADEGRDLEGLADRHGLKWFFECKRFARGVSVKDIADKVLWAEAEKTDVLVVLSNSHLTPSAKRWLNKRDAVRPIVLVWTDSSFELLCSSLPDIASNHVGRFDIPLTLRGRSFADEVLTPFLVERGGFDKFTSFPFETAELANQAHRQVAAAFAAMMADQPETSSDTAKALQARVWSAKDLIESIVNDTAPPGANHDHVFSPEVKRRLFQRFCTEAGAKAFFIRNSWIDLYVTMERRLAEGLLADGNHVDALEALSHSSFYIDQKSEIPFKVTAHNSSTHSAYRIPKHVDDERSIDDIMEFERSIAIAQLRTRSIRVDTYDGWKLITTAVNARVRQASRRERDRLISHDDFLREVSDAFLEAFEICGIFNQAQQEHNREMLWNLIRAILIGIAASGWLYSMWRMYTMMDPGAQESTYRRIRQNVEAQATAEMQGFMKAIVAETANRDRVYSHFYSYVFGLV